MAFRKNKKFIDPRYFMDEKTELTETQKKRIKNLLEEEIRNGRLIDEGVMQDLARKYGVPLAMVAAIAAGIQGVGAMGGPDDTASAVEQDPIELAGDFETAPDPSPESNRYGPKGRDLLYRGEPMKAVDMPTYHDDPPPIYAPLGRKIKEALLEGGFAGHYENPATLGHKASQKLSRVGIASEPEDVRKEIMDMILALDTGDENDAETLANMAAYLKDASAVNVRQGLGLEGKKDQKLSTLTEGGQWPGSRTSLQAVASLSDAIANDLGVDLYEADIDTRLADIVLKEFYEGEEAPLRIGTPTEKPWALKKRLGIGGSVHDRLGGPRGLMGAPKK